MSNLSKKITSAVAGLSVVFSIVSPVAWVSAAYSQVEAANKLASLNVIVDQSANPANYRLWDSITRREMAKITLNLSWDQVEDTCQGLYSDLQPGDWGCKYAEAGWSKWFFASNTNFRPDDNISKWESLKMVMLSRGLEKSDDADFRKGYVDWALEAWLITQSFMDYDTPATRGWIFLSGAEAVEPSSDMSDDDILSDILWDLTDLDNTDDNTNSGDDTTDWMDDSNTSTNNGTNSLWVTLSPNTPASATVPAWANGIKIAAFDFTAGSEDVTVSSLLVKRRGLWDKDTITSLAVYTSEGRASNNKNDNQNNDTEANLNLDGGWIVVNAWETKTLWIVADLGIADDAAQDEFAIEIIDVVASSDVDGINSSLVSNTMRIGSVDAPTLTVKKSSSVSDPKLGETDADIFEFKLDWDNDEDVILKSITFQDDEGDAEQDLSNFRLYMNNDLIAETAWMNNDYLTFDLWDWIVIKENQLEDFTVTADVNEWAGDDITFFVDEKLDVSAVSTKYGYGASIDISAVDNSSSTANFGTITLEAWELTIVEFEATNDKIREDKDNVEIGWFKVTNVAWKDVELQELGILVDLQLSWTSDTSPTTSAPYVDENGNGQYDSWTENFLTAADLFTDFNVVVEWGGSYQLDPGALVNTYDSVFSDDSVDINLPQGVTTFTFEVDTVNNIENFDNATITLSFTTWHVSSTTWGFYAEDYEDNEEITDITPSSVTYNNIDGSESSAVVSVVPLADNTVVRGAKWVVALQFEVEADESSDITVDEFLVKVQADVDGTPKAATNQEIAQAKLYKNSVSDSNLLDSEAGSQISSVWEFQFNDFPDVAIKANQTVTFIVTLDFVDWVNAVSNSDYNTSLTFIDVQDDENDTVDVSVTWVVSARDITVESFGVLSLTNDENNEDNKDDKTILGWTSGVVFSIDVESINESMDVEDVIFTLTWASAADIKASVQNANLWLNNTKIETNVNWDIVSTTSSGTTEIRFTDLENLIVEEATSELRLELNTETIWYQKVGKTLKGLTVTNVRLENSTWVDSGKDATDLSVAVTTSPSFTIAPATVTPTVAVSLNNSDTPEVRFLATLGNNTKDTNNSTSNVTLTQLTFSTLGSNFDSWSNPVFKINNKDDAWIIVTGTYSWVTDTLVFNMTGLSSWSNNVLSNGVSETFKISVSGIDAGNNRDTVVLKLLEQGTVYSVTDNADANGLTTNLSEELDLGTRK